jgi:nucleoside-diphosphate-sugar epimerase
VRFLVTGAAGFIGSHVCQRLLRDSHHVVAVDKLTDYYDVQVKQDNVSAFANRPGVRFLRADVRSLEVLSLVADVDVVLHLAAQPGVRPSWAQLPLYLRENVEVVHALLESARLLAHPPRLVLASSSSVYGDAARYPCKETDPTRPVSPYGVSKLCMEQLTAAYVAAYGLPAVSLRYFTVYGPRQRPDMAFHRFVEAAAAGQPVQVFGDGEQVREYTYVEDVAEATVRAGQSELAPGSVLNVCGGEPTTVNEVLELLARLMRRSIDVVHGHAATGDVQRTGGSTRQVHQALGWAPETRLTDGLAAQIAWHADRARSTAELLAL